MVVVSTAAFQFGVQNKNVSSSSIRESQYCGEPTWPKSSVHGLRPQGFKSCVWRAVSSHHPQEIILAQFSLYVHKGGPKPDSFHFICKHGAMVVTLAIELHSVPGSDSACRVTVVLTMEKPSRRVLQCSHVQATCCFSLERAHGRCRQSWGILESTRAFFCFTNKIRQGTTPARRSVGVSRFCVVLSRCSLSFSGISRLHAIHTAARRRDSFLNPAHRWDTFLNLTRGSLHPVFVFITHIHSGVWNKTGRDVYRLTFWVNKNS